MNKKMNCHLTNQMSKNIKTNDLIICSDGQNMIVRKGKYLSKVPWPKELKIIIPNAVNPIFEFFTQQINKGD